MEPRVNRMGEGGSSRWPSTARRASGLLVLACLSQRKQVPACPFAMSLSKGASWFDPSALLSAGRLTTSGKAITAHLRKTGTSSLLHCISWCRA